MHVLFLCTGNSCRSQIAEGYAKALWPKYMEASSAGTNPHGMNPLTVQVMAEVGIDISGHWSKSVEDIDLGSIDIVATVCDDAKETCPVLPGVGRQIHRSFEDPYTLGKGLPESEALVEYRRIRDEIRLWIESLPSQLEEL